MNIILLAVSFLCVFNVVRYRGAQQFLWFYISAAMLHSNVYPGHNNMILGYVFMFFLTINKNILVERWRSYPFKIITIILLITHILNAFLNIHLPLHRALRAAAGNYCLSVLVVFLGYCAIQKKNDIIYLRDKFIVMMYIISILGIVVGILGTNPWLSAAGLTYPGANSGKISALIGSANTHAFTLFIPFLFCISNYQSKHTKWLSILILLNLILSNHRAPIVDLILGAGIALLLGYKLVIKKTWYYIPIITTFVFFLFAFNIFNINDVYSEKKASITQAISVDDYQDAEGSSVAMRVLQVENAVIEAGDDIVKGKGIGYSKLKYSENDGVSLDMGGLFGLESYIIWLLLDDGIVQGSLILLFYILIIIRFCKNSVKYSTNEYVKAGAICIIITLFHLILNRPWGIFEVSMPLIGLLLYLSQNHTNSKSI